MSQLCFETQMFGWYCVRKELSPCSCLCVVRSRAWKWLRWKVKVSRRTFYPRFIHIFCLARGTRLPIRNSSFAHAICRELKLKARRLRILDDGVKQHASMTNLVVVAKLAVFVLLSTWRLISQSKTKSLRDGVSKRHRIWSENNEFRTRSRTCWVVLFTWQRRLLHRRQLKNCVENVATAFHVAF